MTAVVFRGPSLGDGGRGGGQERKEQGDSDQLGDAAGGADHGGSSLLGVHFLVIHNQEDRVFHRT